MSTVSIEPLLHHRHRSGHRSTSNLIKLSSLSAFPRKAEFRGRSFCNFRRPTPLTLRASSTDTAVASSSESVEPFFKEMFPLERIELVEGKIFVRLDHGKDDRNWMLTVGCTLSGKWILHWGVSLVGDVGSEWDQPPEEMRPPGSVPIKNYAIETPLTESSSISLGGDISQEVKIDVNLDNAIAAINFVLKDEETGAWYQHRGRDFKVPLVGYLQEGGNVVGAKKGSGVLPGALGKLTGIFYKPESSNSQEKDTSSESRGTKEETRSLEGFYEELPITKEIAVVNSVTVSVRKCPETAKNLLYLETDLPDHVVVHWGVCKDDAKRWEIPATPHPPETVVFKDKALRTRLQHKEGGNGCWGLFTLEEGLAGFLFVFKLSETTWLKCKGNDFYIPLSSANISPAIAKEDHSEGAIVEGRSAEEIEESSFTEYTNGIINEIRTLVSGISSEKS